VLSAGSQPWRQEDYTGPALLFFYIQFLKVSIGGSISAVFKIAKLFSNIFVHEEGLPIPALYMYYIDIP
jgi:hypothetical protein